MTLSKPITRRDLLRAGAAASGSLLIGPAAWARTYSANEKIRFACIGIGGMGGKGVRVASGEIDVAEETLREIISGAGLNPLDGYIRDCLMDALNEHAPPYCYFGSHVGDGADFGFWISDDAIRDGIHDGDILAVSDERNAEQSTVPEYVLHANDHGNETLHRIKLEEVWSIV